MIAAVFHIHYWFLIENFLPFETIYISFVPQLLHFNRKKKFSVGVKQFGFSIITFPTFLYILNINVVLTITNFQLNVNVKMNLKVKLKPQYKLELYLIISQIP